MGEVGEGVLGPGGGSGFALRRSNSPFDVRSSGRRGGRRRVVLLPLCEPPLPLALLTDALRACESADETACKGVREACAGALEEEGVGGTTSTEAAAC